MKNQHFSPTKTAIFAYFAHQATPLERQQVEAWIKTEEGAELYFTYLDEWERQHLQFQPDLDQARDQFNLFMRQTDSRNTTSLLDTTVKSLIDQPDEGAKVRWLSLNRWFFIAASILLLIGLWLSIDFWYFKTWTNQYSQIQTIHLPDGSDVELGANSSLRQPRFGIWLGNPARLARGRG